MSKTPLWDMLNTWKNSCHWVDLSYEMSPDTPHWVGFETMKIVTTLDLDTSPFSCHTYSTVGQFGTHVDVAAHMHKGGRTLESLDIEKMILPLCVLDLTDACTRDPDYEVSVDDITDWEQKHGRIPPGSFVAFQSGWSLRAPADMDNLDADGNRHFPGWSLQALQFLVEERDIAAIGHDTSDTEAPVSSRVTNYGIERYILAQDRFQVELLVNLEKCPPAGAVIFCTFPKIKGGTGFPCRCFALCPR